MPAVLVSPDGATYVYPELVSPPPPAPAASGSRQGPGGPISDTRIHIVDVASTTDRVIFDATAGWATVGYTGKEVYLIHAQPEAAPDSGLYALDVSTLALHELSAPLPAGSEASPIAWKLIGKDAAWGSDLDGRLFRLDFLTRTASLWLGLPGKIREPIALDLEGKPIVSGDPFGAWLVSTPQQVVQIADETTWVDDASADAHGIWLLTDQGVYLWAPGGAFTLVSAAVRQSGLSRRLAGPCQ